MNESATKPLDDGTTNDDNETKTSAEGKDVGMSEINTTNKSGSISDTEEAAGGHLRPQLTMMMLVETSHSPANSSDTDKAHGSSPNTPTTTTGVV